MDQNQCLQLLELVSLKAQHSAMCLALVVVKDPKHSDFQKQFKALAMNPTDTSKQIIGLLTLGELGKLVDQSKDAGVLQLL